jgi:hypothetical protein
MAVESLNQGGEGPEETVEMPASTPWPIVLAFGIALLVAGLVTSGAVSVLGAIISIAGAVGWFRDVLPDEARETVRLAPQVGAVTTKRAWLPLEIYPISAGIKGGLAGSVAMAVLAMLYGILSEKSIWYPINLLPAGFFPGAMTATTAEIAAFHLRALLLAIPIHLVTSLLVGLLYGAMLPMLPRRPILLGGFIAPVLWTGLIHSILGVVNPALNQRIDWLWFVISQIGFGIVAGIVVSRQQRIPTEQRVPLALRVGLEASGMRDEQRGEDHRR